MEIDFTIFDSYKDKSLWPYQQEIKSKIYNEWQTKKSVMLQMPTGTGKTKLFCSIITDIHNFGRDNKKAYKVLVLTHKEELVIQIVDELSLKYGIACGIIQSRAMEFLKIPTQVACVPTLIRRLDKWTFKDFDFIIVDEAHHIKAESYQKIIKAFNRAKLLGLTATPYRLSGEGFTKEFDTLIVGPAIKELQKDGYLSQYHYFSIGNNTSIQMTLDSIIKEDVDGDYDKNELNRIYDKDKIRAQIVETYQKYAAGKKGIVYTISQDHNQHLLNAFTEKGIKAAAIDSNTNNEKRKEIIEDFRKGKYDVLLNVNIFSEGFDCPDIEFIQLARPTKSLSMYLQQVGRGLRKHDNKDAVVILDNVGLYNRFGLPSAKRNWEFYFKGKDKDENRKHFVNRSLNIERKQRMKDLSEGNEEVNLIYTSHDELLGDDYADILDPGIANEVAEYLYQRYCSCARKVHEESYKRYELCKHELGYYYLTTKDNKEFNINIREKLARKGGKYFDLLNKWTFEQIVIFHLFYDRIKLFSTVVDFCEEVVENNQIPNDELNKKFDCFMNLCKERYDGFSREIFSLFNYFGMGKEYLDKKEYGLRNRFLADLWGEMYFFNAIYNILNGVSYDITE